MGNHDDKAINTSIDDQFNFSPEFLRALCNNEIATDKEPWRSGDIRKYIDELAVKIESELDVVVRVWHDPAPWSAFSKMSVYRESPELVHDFGDGEKHFKGVSINLSYLAPYCSIGWSYLTPPGSWGGWSNYEIDSVALPELQVLIANVTAIIESAGFIYLPLHILSKSLPDGIEPKHSFFDPPWHVEDAFFWMDD